MAQVNLLHFQLFLAIVDVPFDLIIYIDWNIYIGM